MFLLRDAELCDEVARRPFAYSGPLRSSSILVVVLGEKVLMGFSKLKGSHLSLNEELCLYDPSKYISRYDHDGR